MGPEDKIKLDQILRMTEENNAILRRMHRQATVGSIIRIIYWVLIIGVSVASYYYIQPYLATLTSFIAQSGKFTALMGK